MINKSKQNKDKSWYDNSHLSLPQMTWVNLKVGLGWTELSDTR